jgi:PIN domain
MRVVVDANLIIERDWHLTTGPAEALLSAARRGRVRLVLPEVVVREVVAAHAERRAAARGKLQAARAALRRLEGPRGPGDDAEAADPFIRQTFESWFRDRLAQHRVEVPDVPEAAAALVDRALQRRRPFDSNGRAGFRDALIWETVLEGASSAQTTLLASDNVRDFADDSNTAPHPHLREDLTARGLDAAAVRLVRSFEEAAHVALEPAREVVDRLRERLAREPEWADELTEQMRQEVQADMPDIDDTGVVVSIESGGEPFEGDIVGSELEDVTISGAPSVADAFPLTDGVYAVQLEVPAEAVYELDVSTHGFWQQPNRVPANVRLSGDERSAYFSGFARVRALFDARYRAETDELSQLSLMGLADGD